MRARRRFLQAMIASALASPLPTLAQGASRIPRIGFLASGNPVGTPQYDAFLQGLRDHGYIDGKTIRIEHRWIEQKLERLPVLARELVQMPVELIVAWGSASVAAAKQATSTVPIVMIAVSDPVAQGFVASLAKPGGNITGMSNRLLGTIAKNVEMLIKVVPGTRRVGILRNPENPAHGIVLEEAETAAREQGVTLRVVDANSPASLEGAVATLARERVSGVVVIGDPMFMTQRARIAELAKQARLPSTTIFRQYPEAGGLMSYGLNTTDMFRREAYFVDKILRGTKPAELPVEHPTTYEMVFNLRTARAIGVGVPEDMLLRADKVIE